MMVVLFFLNTPGAFSQEKKSDADIAFSNREWKKALDLYSRAYDNKSNVHTLYKIGLCQYNLNRCVQAGNTFLTYMKTKQTYHDPDLLLLIAQCYHHEQNFKEAANFYKLTLSNIGNKDKRKQSIINNIKRCATGIEISKSDKRFYLENLGEDINSEWDDFKPVLSPNVEDKFYYSSIRETNMGGKRNARGIKDEGKDGFFCSDIYVTQLENGAWSPSKPLPQTVNSPRNDVLQDFNAAGKILYYYKGFTMDAGEIFTDTFSNTADFTKQNFPVKTSMVPEMGDRDLFWIDEQTILFSSRRLGGYGGYDLYISRQEQGEWLEPQNLGPVVNSAYDEVAPFLSADGISLYFSSNNLKSIGGFDIFRSEFSMSGNNWETPENYGIPVNSAGDDLYFRMKKDGLGGFYSSDRKDMGYGGSDIYIIYFKIQSTEQLYTGVEPDIYQIFKDANKTAAAYDEPENGSVKPGKTIITSKAIDLILAPVYYDPGNFLLNENQINQLKELIKAYKVSPNMMIVLSGFTSEEAPNRLDLFFSIQNTEKIASFLVQNGVKSDRIICQGMGATYPIAMNEVNGQPNLPGIRLNNRIDVNIYNIDSSKVNLTYDPPKVSDYMKNSDGTEYYRKIKKLTYRVQFTILKQMYKGSALSTFKDPLIESIFNTNSYKFLVGAETTFKSAKTFLQKVRAAGFADAFLVAYIDGVRVNKDSIGNDLIRQYPDLQNYIKQ